MNSKTNPENYWEPNSFWMQAQNSFITDGAIPNSLIPELERGQHLSDKRISQLCWALLKIEKNPSEATKVNDSFINWLLTKRNEKVMEKAFKKPNIKNRTTSSKRSPIVKYLT